MNLIYRPHWAMAHTLPAGIRFEAISTRPIPVAERGRTTDDAKRSQHNAIYTVEVAVPITATWAQRSAVIKAMGNVALVSDDGGSIYIAHHFTYVDVLDILAHLRTALSLPASEPSDTEVQG